MMYAVWCLLSRMSPVGHVHLNPGHLSSALSSIIQLHPRGPVSTQSNKTYYFRAFL